mmetsp:Transcript_41581/g.82285  ORF Transcript_41581/g.82285 Transcript_41581/m.82285 type:complete len:373 (-) Transcript_41581:48-1166(-)
MPGAVTHCPTGHSLKKVISGMLQGHECNVCGREIRRVESRFMCMESCDFAACIECGSRHGAHDHASAKDINLKTCLANEDKDYPASSQRDQWQEEALRVHNELRLRHGAPPLEWSVECYKAAKLQADTCQKQGGLSHGNMKGPSGRYGQNAFWSSKRGTATDAIQYWYREMKDHCFDKGYQGNTGHFSQVVWVASVSMGLAASEDGKFIVANYFPAGNIATPGFFSNNVLPLGSKMVERLKSHDHDGRRSSQHKGMPNVNMLHREAPCVTKWHPTTATGATGHRMEPCVGHHSDQHPAHDVRGGAGHTGTVTAMEMTPEMEAMFKGCPFNDFKRKAADAFLHGGEVTVERAETSIKVTTKVGMCTTKAGGSW